MVFFGAGIPALTVIGYLPANFLLLGIAAIASMVGAFLGYYAMAIYVREHRASKPRRSKDDYFFHNGNE